jgi:uncharacterized protein (DUF58 family)
MQLDHAKFRSNFAAIRRLPWPILRTLAVRPGGSERSKIRGTGVEFADVREYQPGDDVRYIDWSISARTDTVYVRESHAERALDIWLLLDRSASVDWGTSRQLKRDLGLELAAAAGMLLTGQGNRIGALIAGGATPVLIPPGTGRSHAIRLLQRCREGGEAERRRTDLAAAIRQTERLARQPALVLVASDFLAPDGWQSALRRLSIRHEVIACWLRDPREDSLPDIGVAVFEDPETGRQITVDTRDRRLRERFAAAAAAQRASIASGIAGAGAECLTLTTDTPLVNQLASFLRRRRSQRAARGGMLASHLRARGG